MFAGYLAASTLTIVLLSVSQPGDAVEVAAGLLIIVVGLTAAVHTFVAFAPTQQAAGGSRASKRAVATARARMRRRRKARELAERDPVLARELGIGRQDVPHDYDDGGLVDVNHVPAAILASHLGLTPAEVTAVITARDKLGRFSSTDELSAYADLPPGRLDELRDWLLLG